MPGRGHHLVAVGVVAMVALGATAGAAPAPAGGEESIAPPPVARVAGELARSGARVAVELGEDSVALGTWKVVRATV